MAEDETDPLSPDEAFAALGNETRVRILRVLGEAGDPLSFSALYDEMAMRDSGQFNYHLEKLVGHFVRKTDAGYELDRAGRRVVESILSGAVTDDASFERTPIDERCDICGEPVEAAYKDGGIELYCTECDGRYQRRRRSGGKSDDGYLGALPLPPAGLRNRSADAVSRAAWTWTNLEIMAMASGICPRCSAPIESQPDICVDHDTETDTCPSCGGYYAVSVGFECTNCTFSSGGAGVLAMLSDTRFLDFLTDHGHNPIDPDSTRAVSAVEMNYEETIIDEDPFEAEFTFESDGETLTLTVDADLSIVEAVRE
ncbi:winged helix-turn-helix domain-containing protein [Halapricum hydrolyticum]|uniref:Helix-turn-helix domain-containing protein n=1 Tax=Halapricum hydrolyticum TaxID=2979991 RepID=A0AAE3LEV0_9EURY|nr:helix-turn-helix domain-containing protein [Halapricum hydrolyticum]MCU4717391.1 helix-turn-helix domain-containing protein [Halapricum hydrolyticum]MCU4726555.1 helix-turn-helix domain-containing protein [Halapricum hydrolyticum]